MLLSRKVSKKEHGIGLIETVVALGVTVVVLTALVSLAVSTLRTSNTSKIKLRGAKFANSELELVRACRDANPSWDDFVTMLSDQSCDIDGATCYMVLDGTASSDCVLGSDLGISTGAGGKVYDAGGPLELHIGFNVADLAGGTVDPNDTAIRVTVWTLSEVGGTEIKNYIYSDLTDWRSN